ncbi:MAG: hypothetical protein AAF602_24725, partial [Myxococcota bacterium]
MRTLVAWMLACSGDDVDQLPFEETRPPESPDDSGVAPDPLDPEVVTVVQSPDGPELGIREPLILVFDAPMDPTTLELDGTLVSPIELEVAWSASEGLDPARLELAPRSTWTASPAHTLEIAVDSAAGTRVEVTATFAVSTQIAFVTTERGSGDLSSWPSAGGAAGRAAGDAICAAEAQQAGLTGDFRAVLNDGLTDAACTLYGLEGQLGDNCGVPDLPEPVTWQRPDGLPLGDSDQLVDAFLLHPVAPLSGFGTVSAVWYGTRPLNCGDWTRGDDAAQ